MPIALNRHVDAVRTSTSRSHRHISRGIYSVVLTALSIGLFLTIAGRPAVAKDIQWSGYTWHVRNDDNSGPGPNNWSADNVWIDSGGQLHLKIAHNGDKWSCAEIWTDDRLGFGRYEFDLGWPPASQGQANLDVNKLDDNVVLGLFNYPTSDIGSDGTNEIDIEFATWGGQQKIHGNWTVWPAVTGADHESYPFKPGNLNTFRWTSDAVSFESEYLPGPGTTGIWPAPERWEYRPDDYKRLIPQHPLPVHINLWLFNGKPPKDDKEVEIVISSFRFTPRNGR